MEQMSTKSTFTSTIDHNMQSKSELELAEEIPSYIPLSFRGAGAFGYVVEAYDKNNDLRVAIKRTHKVGTKISREYKILSVLKGCPYTVQMLNTFYSVNEEGVTVQNIVFEYVSNNLDNEIEKLKSKKEVFDIKELQTICSQILEGLVFAHKKNVVHRDLKPENVLYTNEKMVKICDFGSSKIILKKKSALNFGKESSDSNSEDEKEVDTTFYNRNGIITKSTPYIVSRYYRAPELILGCNTYDSSIDIFACGCIFFELAALKPLFPGRAEGMQLFEQMTVLGILPKDYLDSFPCGKLLKSLVSRIQDINKLSRIQ